LEMLVANLEGQLRKMAAKNNVLRVNLFKVKCEAEAREKEYEKQTEGLMAEVEELKTELLRQRTEPSVEAHQRMTD